MAAEHEAQVESASRYSVGDELRMHREAMGKSIADIVDAVRIQSRYLEALEDSRLEDLPGTVYALGFVRTYADYLGLNGAEFVARYKEETEGLGAQSYVMPEPLEEGKVPTAAILLVAVVLAAAAYGGWYFFSQPDMRISQQVPDVPERLSAVTEEPAAEGPEGARAVPPPAAAPTPPTSPAPSFPAEGDAPPPTAAAGQPAVMPVTPPADTAPAGEPEPVAAPTATAVAEPATQTPESQEVPQAPEPQEVPRAPEAPEMATPPTPERPEAQQTAEVPEAPLTTGAAETVVAVAPPSPPADEAPREPRVYGQGNADSRIVIIAEEDAWIEVTDSDDARLFSRVLRKGDRYLAPNREGAKFVTGNAGGLKIMVDGEQVPALGPPGQVRRDVKLNADLLKAGDAWP